MDLHTSQTSVNSETQRLLSVVNLLEVVGLLEALKNILRKILMHFKILQILWSFEWTVVNILKRYTITCPGQIIRNNNFFETPMDSIKVFLIFNDKDGKWLWYEILKLMSKTPETGLSKMCQQ
jgi:hypothetical protein